VHEGGQGGADEVDSGLMLRRLQRWMGNRAPINVSSLAYLIIGARHPEPLDYKRCRDAVHRSYESYVECMQLQVIEDYRQFLKREQLSAEETLVRIAKFEAMAAESREMVKKLRLF